MMLYPPEIRTVSLVAPAGKLAEEPFAAGIAALRNAGIQVKVQPHVNGPSEVRYLAASVDDRVADLSAAWEDPANDLILCVRGGFGSAQLLDHLQWPGLQARPTLPVVGYSDITALHWAMLRHRAGRGIIAPMLGKLPALTQSRWMRDSLNRVLRRESHELAAATEFGPLLTLRPGNAAGPLLAGNLAVATTLLGTPHLPDPAGAILCFEDLNEPVYKLDRYLTQWEMSGALAASAGILFGQFLDCGAPEEVLALFQRYATKLNVPVLANLPFGHGLPLAALEVGGPATIENGRVFLY